MHIYIERREYWGTVLFFKNLICHFKSNNWIIGFKKLINTIPRFRKIFDRNSEKMIEHNCFSRFNKAKLT